MLLNMAAPAFTSNNEFFGEVSFWPNEGERGVIGLNISLLIERQKQKMRALRAYGLFMLSRLNVSQVK